MVVLSLGAVLISPFTDVDDAIHHHRQHHQFGLTVQQTAVTADMSLLSVTVFAVSGVENEAQISISTLRC